MADVGLNQKITAGSRNFHIQTATLINDGVIRAEVFEKGRVLFVETHQYERRNGSSDKGANGRLRKIVDNFHQSIIEEVDCLFEISESVIEEGQPGPHEKIGLVFLFMRIFDKAEKHFRAAIELEPERLSSHIYLARSHFLQKKYNRAAEILNSLLAKNVEFPDFHNLFGLVLMEQGQYAKSLQNFKTALKKNPAYIEAYFNLAEAILRRLVRAQSTLKKEELQKSLSFLNILLKKIVNMGNANDRHQSGLIGKALGSMGLKKALTLINEYRDSQFLRRIPPEIYGYKFYLRLVYGEEELPANSLELYERKITQALNNNPSYPDLWHYLALIHLMQCRHYFLKGMDNFRDATRINPSFDKALKNLRLVENDGREFLSLIKTII